MPLGVLSAALAALFLPAAVVVGIGLSVVDANIDEIRSLPKVYLWLVSSFVVLWLIGLPFMLAAVRGRLEWAARGLIALGINIMLWDAFRSLWLASYLHVAVFALLEVACWVAIVRLLRRLETSTLLSYAGMFAVLQIAVITGLHVQQRGVRVVAHAFRDLVVANEDRPAHHPDPWTRLPDGAVEMRGALDASSRRWESGIAGDPSASIRFAADDASDRPIAAIPILLDAPLDTPAVAELKLRVEQGSVRLGIRSEATGSWFYRRDVGHADGAEQTVYLPIFEGAPSGVAVEIAGIAGAPVSPVVVVEAMRVHRLPARLGEVAGARHGNVYQILLDGAQDDLYVALADAQPKFRFPGFTLYRDFHTTSRTTAWSLPAIMSSTIYDPGMGMSAAQWSENAYQTGLHSELHGAGVPIDDYAFHRKWCYDQADFCFTTEDYRSELLEQVADTFVVDFVFLRCLPNSVRAILIESPRRARPAADSWDVGFSLTSLFQRSAKDSRFDSFLKTGDFLINVFTVAYFEQMMAEETLRPAAGQYVFFHLMLPHGPFMWDENCEVIPKAERTPESHAARKLLQTACTYELVRRFVENLKALDRYDDATIIIHSDHGLPVPPDSAKGFHSDEAEQSDEWPEWYLESVSSGLLMIKWPHATDAAVSDLSVVSLDIAPTVLEQLDIPIPDRFEGRAIQTMPADVERTKVFYGDKGSRTQQAHAFNKFVKTGGAWVLEGTVPATPGDASK